MKTPIRSILTAGAAMLFGLLAAPVRADILYVSSLASHTIKTLPPGGVSPLGLAFDSVGNLYVANGSTIEKFTPGGVRSIFASGLNNLTGLAFDTLGNLYVASSIGTVDTIMKFTPSGVRSVFTYNVYRPRSLAFDGAGNLYVANLNSILIFDPRGVERPFVGSGLIVPTGLAFGIDGNLYVVDAATAAILKFNNSGVGSVFASTGSVVDYYPSGLAFDSADNLYVANFGEGSIREFTPSGVSLPFGTSGLVQPTSLAFTNDAGVPIYPHLPQFPEPSTWAMLALGLPALLASRRRK